jgi:hypothetical protein
MANRNSIKLVSISHDRGGRISLKLQLAGKTETYTASLVDRDGIFGLELDEDLGMKLRELPPPETRELIARVKKEVHQELMPA